MTLCEAEAAIAYAARLGRVADALAAIVQRPHDAVDLAALAGRELASALAQARADAAEGMRVVRQVSREAEAIANE